MADLAKVPKEQSLTKEEWERRQAQTNHPLTWPPNHSHSSSKQTEGRKQL